MELFGAAGISCGAVLVLTPALLHWLKKEDIGQRIREDGPVTHTSKAGIPTMGGVLFWPALFLPVLFFNRWSPFTIWTLIMVLGFSGIGFWDDFMKLQKARSLGLKGRQKIFLMVLLSSLLGLYIYIYEAGSTLLLIPFWEQSISLGPWIIPFVVLVFLATTNAVNLTDGLDGLAAGVSGIALMGFFFLALLVGKTDGTFLAAAGVGLCAGFLWFNCHPARIFMGDTGSLSLGALLASIAVFQNLSVFLLLTGGLFVLITLSVIVQVLYFRITGGKRIFRMSPLHHHFELIGWAEPAIVVRFWILSLGFALLGIGGVL